MARLHSCGQPDCLYNELVFDAAVWVRELPRTIPAIFFPKGGDPAHARGLRDRFADAFGLVRSAVPLLRLDLTDLDSPFEVAQ